jgi:hypothetical protein
MRPIPQGARCANDKDHQDLRREGLDEPGGMKQCFVNPEDPEQQPESNEVEY